MYVIPTNLQFHPGWMLGLCHQNQCKQTAEIKFDTVNKIECETES